MTELAGFLAPMDADTFRSQYFGLRPVHIRRDTGGQPSILSWSRFNEVLGLTPYWNDRIVRVSAKAARLGG